MASAAGNLFTGGEFEASDSTVASNPFDESFGESLAGNSSLSPISDSSPFLAPPTAHQEQTSFPFMTAACATFIVMNLLLYPIDYVWKSNFPRFRSLPKNMHRHDANLILRTCTGPAVAVAAVYITVETFRDVEWFFENETFVACWLLVFLLIDLFDLSQRRRFDWQPYVHHILQTVYGLYLFEWSSNYRSSFPSLGLVIASLSNRWYFSLFPLRRAAPGNKIVVSYAKFCFWQVIISVSLGLAVMIGLIIKYKSYVSWLAIVQPIAYVAFQCLDLPMYVFIYKIAGYEKSVVDEKECGEKSGKGSETDEECGKASGAGGVSNTIRSPSFVAHVRNGSVVAHLDELLSKDGHHTLFGHPYFFDGDDDGDEDNIGRTAQTRRRSTVG